MVRAVHAALDLLLGGEARDHRPHLVRPHATVPDGSDDFGRIAEQVLLEPAGIGRGAGREQSEAPADPFAREELDDQQQRYRRQGQQESSLARRHAQTRGLTLPDILEPQPDHVALRRARAGPRGSSAPADRPRARGSMRSVTAWSSITPSRSAKAKSWAKA